MEKERTKNNEQQAEPKKKSKLKVVIIIVVLLAVIFGTIAFLTSKSSLGISYALKGDDTYEVVSISSTFKNVVIPSTHDGKPVTSIKAEAATFKNLNSVTIPDSITNIGEKAFEGNSFQELIIPDSVTMIGERAFFGCNELSTVSIGKGIVNIGLEAFSECKVLSTVTFAEECALQSIDRWAFAKCTKLTTIKLPNSVTDIGSEAFVFCDSLQYNDFDNGLYLGSESNPYLYFSKTKSSDITTFEFHNDVVVIGDDEPFSRCKRLAQISFPQSVKTINNFSNGAALNRISIPAGVKRLGLSLTYSAEENNSIFIFFDGTKSDWTALTNVGTRSDEWFISVNCIDGMVKRDK